MRTCPPLCPSSRSACTTTRPAACSTPRGARAAWTHAPRRRPSSWTSPRASAGRSRRCRRPSRACSRTLRRGLPSMRRCRATAASRTVRVMSSLRASAPAPWLRTCGARPRSGGRRTGKRSSGPPRAPRSWARWPWRAARSRSTSRGSASRGRARTGDDAWAALALFHLRRSPLAATDGRTAALLYRRVTRAACARSAVLPCQ
mmetsp:Transcript_18622/g.37951  ORF Transcript_18622/g.37951 Transcript_18622/m.37951 type:complete len:203 (-) Transcript_18622:101-709(-)